MSTFIVVDLPAFDGPWNRTAWGTSAVSCFRSSTSRWSSICSRTSDFSFFARQSTRWPLSSWPMRSHASLAAGSCAAVTKPRMVVFLEVSLESSEPADDESAKWKRTARAKRTEKTSTGPKTWACAMYRSRSAAVYSR
eukprot:2447762-Prymnesium_polylepis.2